MAESIHKFMGRNRPGRIPISFKVMVGNAEKEVQIPFVMGVLADLAGKSEKFDPKSEEFIPIHKREFTPIDAENFDRKLDAMKPRVEFLVPNMLDESDKRGNLKIDITFESLDDFSDPKVIAKKVPELEKLLKARSQLDSLLGFIDGKPIAEDLIYRLISDPSLRQALISVKESSKQNADETSTEKTSEDKE